MRLSSATNPGEPAAPERSRPPRIVGRMLPPMRAIILTPIFVAIAGASLHDAIDGPHGSDPRQPTRAPQARIVVYVSVQSDSPAALAAFAESLRRPTTSELFKLV